jgi:hypothetical protein
MISIRRCPDARRSWAIAIKAWNAWREGKTLQTLGWRAEGRRAEPFPEAN